MMTLNPPYDDFTPPSPLCTFKSHESDNCEKAWYIASTGANLFARPFTWPQGRVNYPSLPRHTEKHLLKYTVFKSLRHKWTNLKEPYNQGIKVQVTAKDIKKEDRCCMKFRNPEAWCAEGVFQIQLPNMSRLRFCLKEKHLHWEWQFVWHLPLGYRSSTIRYGQHCNISHIRCKYFPNIPDLLGPRTRRRNRLPFLPVISRQIVLSNLMSLCFFDW